MVFRADLVQGAKRRAGQFELTTGFEADVGGQAAAGVGAFETDHGFAAILAVFHHRGPAKPFQPVEQGLDAIRAIVGNGGQGVGAKAELFMLGADAPVGLGLAALGHHPREGFHIQRTIIHSALAHLCRVPAVLGPSVRRRGLAAIRLPAR